MLVSAAVSDPKSRLLTRRKSKRNFPKNAQFSIVTGVVVVQVDCNPKMGRDDEDKSFLLFGTVSVFFGNLATLLVLGVFYVNYTLFQDYAKMLMWSTLLAIGLRRPKAFLAASSDKNWFKRVRGMFEARLLFNSFLLISWLWALCTTFGTVLVLSLHLLAAFLAAGYVRLERTGFSLHRRIGFSNAAAGALVIIIGGFVACAVVLVFFALKCTEEGADALMNLRTWAQSITDDQDENGNALRGQINALLETEQVQTAIDSGRETISSMLESLSQVGGEGLVNQIQGCYEQGNGDASAILECM